MNVVVNPIENFHRTLLKFSSKGLNILAETNIYGFRQIGIRWQALCVCSLKKSACVFNDFSEFLFRRYRFSNF